MRGVVLGIVQIRLVIVDHVLDLRFDNCLQGIGKTSLSGAVFREDDLDILADYQNKHH